MSRAADLLRTLVIGAGAVGASVALRLAQREARVTIVERDRFDQRSDGPLIAWIRASHPVGAAHVAFKARGVAAWRDLYDEFQRPDWLVLCDSLTWSTDAGSRRRLEQWQRTLLDADYRVRELDPARVGIVEPGVRFPSEARSVFLCPDEGCVNNSRLVDALLARARSSGARVREGVEVNALEQEGGCIRVALNDGTKISADSAKRTRFSVVRARQ